MRFLSVALACTATLAMTTLGAEGVGRGSPSHLTGLSVKVTAKDGRTRIIKLEGVGCTTSICSRTMMKAKAEQDALAKVWLDGITAIRDTTDHDALFVMRDGTQKRLALVKDFRVFYLAGESGQSEKIDIDAVKSIEFLPSPR